MKKSILIILLLAVICVVAFTACKNEEGNGGGGDVNPPALPTLESISAEVVKDVTVGDKSIFLQVTARLTDGTSFSVTDYQLSAIDNSTAGEKRITVSYTFLEITKTVEVVYTVNALPVVFTSISASYSGEIKVGDTAIPNLEVKAHYSDGSEKKVGDFEISGFDTTTEGTKTITFSYAEEGIVKTCSLDINVISVVSVSALQSEVEIETREIADFDFKTLFAISKDGNTVAVSDTHLDLSKVDSDVEEFEVACTYEGKTAVVTVIVRKPVFAVLVDTESIRLKQSEVDGYDFLSHFTVTDNGEHVAITLDMWATDLRDAVGEYSLTVYYQDVSGTLKISIVPDFILQAIPSYTSLTLEEYQLENFDFCSLFALYVDGVAEKVTEDMLDLSAIEQCVAGESAEISLFYEKGQASVSASVTVNLVADAQVVVNCKQITVYPNSEYLDLTTLFEVSLGGERIEITQDMVSGEVDYTSAGINTITLSFREQTYTASVEVKTGVVIGFVKGETIEISKGTKQESYAFADDFIVIINGIRFKQIASYVDSSAVDFSTVGEYICKISIPYNDQKGGWTGITYTYVEDQITYKVVDNTFDVTVNEDVVFLKEGTNSYKVYSNLKVKINGKNQTLTENPDYADVITCYVQTLSQPIDFLKPGKQKVEIAVYVNGPEASPLIVSYYVIVESDLTLEPVNVFVYTGDTIYTKDMFVLKNGEEIIPLPQDCISGKVDTFTPGTYHITASYNGLDATAKAVVRDINLLGTYKTPLKTIASNSDFDDEGYEIGETVASKRIGNLVITREKITMQGVELAILDCYDENNMKVRYRSYDYFLSYHNGIILLEPENALEMQYNESMRPFIYFSEDLWTVESSFVINQRADYVLNTTNQGYSIDIAYITSADGESVYYALKTNLISHMNADTVYSVSHGVITFGDDFTGATDNVSTFIFDGETVRFTMIASGAGSINKQEDVREYAGKTFVGTYEGKTAQLIADQYEGFTFKVAGLTVFQIGRYDITSQPGCGSDYLAKTVLLFNSDDRNDEPVYSYKFAVDPENNTFTYIPHDGLVGFYETEGMYFFLDGYGGGVVNFNTKSFYRTQFYYTENNGLLDIRYINVSYDFSHGEGAKFAIDEFGNILTCLDSEGGEFNGLTFVNSYIIDGAMVRISTYKIGANSSVNAAKAEFLSKITIITPDGILSDTDKAAAVDMSTVGWNKPGFCRFSITATRGGEQVVKYYTLQVLPVLYADSPLAITYGSGVMYKENSLALDKFGQIFFNANGRLFEGSVIISDNSFNAKLYDSSNSSITISGTMLYEGLISVTVSGVVNSRDYYTVCENSVAGFKALENSASKDCYLRRFKIGSEYKYFYSYALTAIGEEVALSSLNGIEPQNKGAIVSFTIANGNTLVLRIEAWGDERRGLTYADAYRGVYTHEEETMVLDGFGNVTVGGAVGVYKADGNYVFVTTPSSYTVYRISREDGTYALYTVAMDNTLVEGKIYTATYNFTSGSGLYSATTTIYFDLNGVVTIRSQSSEYKEDNGNYNPVFTTVKGTYSVKNNQISISIGGQSFAFSIENVIKCNSIVCASTSLASGSVGYFSAGTEFAKTE